VTEKLAARRTLLGYLCWGATAVVAAVTLAHALRSGRGWGAAAGASVMFALYGFLPRLQAASARRWQRQDETVTVDDWGVTRVAGDLREAIAWADVGWVRIYTTSEGPGAEDVFFALGAGNGKGCLVPNRLAVSSNLLAAMQQRLPALDNAAIAMAMGSTTEAVFTVWTRAGDSAISAVDKGAS
jgi:hypothetical protein